jgi:hypothetical protein
MAFVFAILVFVVTVIVAAFTLFAYGMSDNPADNKNPFPIWIFLGGSALAILIALSHWGPHIGW